MNPHRYHPREKRFGFSSTGMNRLSAIITGGGYLKGIDVESEYQLILQKKSKLSRSERDLVCERFRVMKQQESLKQ